MIIVDDFETYTNSIASGGAIFQTWIGNDKPDGSLDPANGAIVGHFLAPFAERNITHSGLQSMPLSYDNTTATRSEATRPGPCPRTGPSASGCRSARAGSRATRRGSCILRSATVPEPNASSVWAARRCDHFVLDHAVDSSGGFRRCE